MFVPNLPVPAFARLLTFSLHGEDSPSPWTRTMLKVATENVSGNSVHAFVIRDTASAAPDHEGVRRPSE